MYALILLTVALAIGLASTFAYTQREEVIRNWSKYRENPLFIFTAFLFKPDDDPRSRIKFATDNFSAVIGAVIMKSMAVFFQPLMKLFSGVTAGIEESANGIMNMRGLFKNMFQKFSSITNIFQMRFGRTLNALRVTYIKLQESMNKTFGAAVASLYAGVSTFRAIDNSVRFMTIVAIAILSILLVFTILFFFVLFPILPLIAIALHFVLQTPYAGEVTGMQEAFCFAPSTQIPTTKGPKYIQDITLEDVLLYDGKETRVQATLKFNSNYEPLYDLYGVQVSGAHIYYEDGHPVFVKDARNAHANPFTTEVVYCLITEDHKIPVLSNNGVLLFADWEEIESETDLSAWNQTVFEQLNPDASYVPCAPESLASEAAISDSARIFTPLGIVELRNITPGMSVYDVDGNPTRVTGVVRLDPACVKAVEQLDATTFISLGTWLQRGTVWHQPAIPASPPSDGKWSMLFTESGTFRIITDNFHDYAVRDFSDIGTDQLPSTYASTLKALQSAH
jgi:hypothetical protein